SLRFPGFAQTRMRLPATTPGTAPASIGRMRGQTAATDLRFAISASALMNSSISTSAGLSTRPAWKRRATGTVMEEKPYPSPPLTAAATSATEARTRCSISAPLRVQAAFLVVRRFPPPAAGAHVLAGGDGPRAGCAADGGIPLRVQRIERQLPFARVLPHL